MAFFRLLRILAWVACGLGFGAWLYWTFFITPAVKPDFVSQGEYLNVDGTQVHFLEKGIGRVVILLPGFPLNAESYSHLLEYPWRNRRLIALDLPEQGYSEKKGRPLSPDDFALTLKLFLDKLELADVDLVGHDLGAGVALVFAATYPHRIRKLVLLAPPLGGLATDVLGPWWRWPWVGEVWSFLFLNREWYRHWLSRGWTSPDASWQPLVEQYFRPLSTFSGREGFLAVLRGSSRYAYAAYQERLQVPTLLVRGELDPFCPPAPLRRFQAAFSQVSLKTLPGMGHFLPEEAPRQTYETILGFLGESAQPEAFSSPIPMSAPLLSQKPPLRARRQALLEPAQEKATPISAPTVTLISIPVPAAPSPGPPNTNPEIPPVAGEPAPGATVPAKPEAASPAPAGPQPKGTSATTPP